MTMETPRRLVYAERGCSWALLLNHRICARGRPGSDLLATKSASLLELVHVDVESMTRTVLAHASAMPIEALRVNPTLKLLGSIGLGLSLDRFVADAYRPFRVALASQHFAARLPAGSAELLTGMMGAHDVASLCCMLGPQRLQVLIPLQENEPFQVRARRHLRIQRHLAGAFAKRASPPVSQEAALVMNEHGHVVHATTEAPLYARARDIAKALSLDSRHADEPDETAERLWDELWDAGWTVAQREELDGRRYLLLHRTEAASARLTRRERTVLAMAGRSLSLKQIAFEIGTTAATASSHLQSGLRKLGLSHRLELSDLV